ncbi:glycosyltransferase family protein [Roseixanthobacter glucoisosaccharinicivorans]|uniref:hypothetical protein n=1 Tax=Roseixanthobacter glucoisosaccharinicivorans TaxID=3119923 RepID=UPI00372A01B3
MGRVLLAWELGEGLGHVSRLLPVAQELKRHGHECIFAVRDLGLAAMRLADTDFPLFQAPYAVLPQGRLPFSVGAYGDILGLVGFNEPMRLEALLRGWDQVLDMIRPDLVIGDYCPLLCLAISGAIPVIVLGDGFTLPPADRPTFDPLANRKPSLNEEELLAHVRSVQQRRGRPAPDTLPGILRHAQPFIITLPELDSYAGRRASGVGVGPLQPLPAPAEAPPTCGWFAYLSLSHPSTPALLATLTQLDPTGSAYVRDASSQERASLAGQGIRIHDTPQDLPAAIGAAGALVHHGGLGTLEVGLAVGRPQLIVPRQLEQRINCGLIGGWGGAVSMAVNFTAKNVQDAFQRLKEPSFPQAAREKASELQRRGPFGSLPQIVRASEIHL